MHGIGLRHQASHNSVTRFMVSRVAALFFVHDHSTTFRTHHDLILSIFKVAHFHHTCVAACSKERSFVNQVSQICTREARCTTSDNRSIDISTHGNLAHVNIQNLLATTNIRERNHHLAVETTRTQKCGVKHVGTVRSGNNDHCCTRIKTVHFDEHLVQGLLAFVVTATDTSATMTTHSVNFVHENNARSIFLGVFKHVTYTSSPHTNEHFHKVGTRNGKEWHTRFACNGLSQKRFTRTRRAHQEHTTRNTST